jgi:cytochrome d ubiquinol oxidase subunit II
MMALFDLHIAWASIIALAVFAFVLLDGLDLVVGMLFPPFRLTPKRARAPDSLAAGATSRRARSG